MQEALAGPAALSIDVDEQQPMFDFSYCQTFTFPWSMPMHFSCGGAPVGNTTMANFDPTVFQSGAPILGNATIAKFLSSIFDRMLEHTMTSTAGRLRRRKHRALAAAFTSEEDGLGPALASSA